MGRNGIYQYYKPLYRRRVYAQVVKRDQNPVERKVQLTGGSTYTVSLPKEWASRQDIEPGSHVSLYSRGDQLVLTRRAADPDQTDHTTSIDADGRDPASLALAVTSAYIAGCNEIAVRSIQSHDQRRAVTRAIRGFVGLEVMTEDEEGLLAKTMLDVGDLSPEQTLAQLERTTLEMHEHAVEAVIEADRTAGDQIARQDDDVDRLFALVSRGFQQSLVDPAVTTDNETLTPFEYYMAARQLERIADHAEKIATIAGRLDDPPPEDIATELTDAGTQSREIARRALSGLLDEDNGAAELAAVIADAEALLDAVAETDEQLYDRSLDAGYLLGLVVDSIARTAEYGVNIAEAGLQARHRGQRG
jgi:phosphate uptake regulator